MWWSLTTFIYLSCALKYNFWRTCTFLECFHFQLLYMSIFKANVLYHFIDHLINITQILITTKMLNTASDDEPDRSVTAEHTAYKVHPFKYMYDLLLGVLLILKILVYSTFLPFYYIFYFLLLITFFVILLSFGCCVNQFPRLRDNKGILIHTDWFNICWGKWLPTIEYGSARGFCLLKGIFRLPLSPKCSVCLNELNKEYAVCCELALYNDTIQSEWSIDWLNIRYLYLYFQS